MINIASSNSLFLINYLPDENIENLEELCNSLRIQILDAITALAVSVKNFYRQDKSRTDCSCPA
jgi:hypothetical protein